mgnify:FL=1
MMRTIHRDIVGIVVVSKDGKILHGIQNPETSAHPDCWLIPGGGMNDGESKEDAMIRELKEETGLDISAYALEFLGNSRTASFEKTLRTTGERVLCDMTLYDFRVMIPLQSDDIAVHPSDDLIECKWIGIEELQNFKLPPPSIELFRKLGYIT